MVLDKIKVIYLQATSTTSDLHRNTFNTGTVIFRIAAAVLMFVAGGMQAQELLIPERFDLVKQEVRPLYAKDTVTIRFFGDIMMHTKQIETASDGNDSYDFSTYYKLMKGYLEDSDLNVGNMEFTLGGKPYTGYPSFSAPDNFADYIAGCGFNLFLCANNHIFDKGAAGVTRTLEKYRKLSESHGIHFTGAASDKAGQDANNPLIINLKGIRIAFINATYGTNSFRGKEWPATYIISDRKTLADALATAEYSCSMCSIHSVKDFSKSSAITAEGNSSSSYDKIILPSNL